MEESYTILLKCIRQLILCLMLVICGDHLASAQNLGPQPLEIGTGVSVVDGRDLRWTVSFEGSGYVNAYVPESGQFPGAWLNYSNIGNTSSKWAVPQSFSGTADCPYGVYTYRAEFDLSGFNLSRTTLKFRTASDNGLTQIKINGNQVYESWYPRTVFNEWSPLTTINGNALNQGSNLIEVTVVNDPWNGGNNPAGFRMDGRIEEGFSISTGAHIYTTSEGNRDSNWKVSFDGGADYVCYVPQSGQMPGLWLDHYSEGNTSSKWNTPRSFNSGSDSSPGIYKYTRTFDLTGYDLSRTFLSFKTASDNLLTEIKVNGVSVNEAWYPRPIFVEWSPYSLIHGQLVQGINTIEVVVTNDPYEGGGNPAGFRLDGQIWVSRVGASPVANGITIDALEDESVSVVLTGQPAASGNGLTYVIDTQPSHGVLSGSAPFLVYTPNPNYNGTDSFSFHVVEGLVESSVAIVAISVAAVNDAPVAQSQAVVVEAGSFINLTLNVIDIDSSLLTMVVQNGPQHGVLEGSGISQKYTPSLGFVGTDRVEYAISDGAASSNIVALEITVTSPPNRAPIITSQPIRQMALKLNGNGALVATIRDFSISYPDFEDDVRIGLDTGLVETNLGVDRLPVFNQAKVGGTISNAANFGRWFRDSPGFNYTKSFPISLSETSGGSGLYRFQSDSFFPWDGSGYGNEGLSRNYSFTMEARSKFTYRGDEVLTFTGDDDVWVFIDNKLVIDLGGVHPPQTATIDLSSLGLVVGSTYPIDIFYAERHTAGSTIKLETSLELQGDGVYFYPIAAYDPDGDPITFRLVEAPEGMRIDVQTGRVEWIVGREDEGVHPVVVEVRDSNGATTTQAFELLIYRNQPPYVKIDSRYYSVANPGIAVGLNASVTDDGNPPSSVLLTTWSNYAGLPQATFGSPTSVSTTATFDNNGIAVVRLNAADGEESVSDYAEIRIGEMAMAKLPDGVAAWWPGNSRVEEVINGGHDIALFNGAGFADAKIAQGFKFDGVDDYGVVKSHPDLDVGSSDKGFSIEFWVRAENIGQKDFTLLRYVDGVEIRVLNSGIAPFFRVVDTNGVSRQLFIDGVLAGENNSWVHLAYTYDRITGLARCYKNGIVVAQATIGTGFVPRTNSNLIVGGSGAFRGLLDELTLYRRPLAASEILSIYTSGKDGKSPPDGNARPMVSAGLDIEVAGVESQAELHGFVSDDNKPFGLPDVGWTVLSGPGLATIADPKSLNTNVGFNTPGIYLLQLTASDRSFAPVSDIVEVRVGVQTANISSEIAAWWPGNAHSREVVHGGHDVELLNGASYAAGKVSHGFQFDGINDYGVVEAHPDLDIGTSPAGFSIECWVRADQIGQRDFTILGYLGGVEIRMLNFGQAPFFRIVDTGGVARQFFVGSSFSGKEGVWVHLAYTYDRVSGIARCFQNGLQIAQGNVGTGFIPKTNTNLIFGEAGKFKGMVDEVTLYRHPLAASEITAIYNSGASGKSPLAVINQTPSVNAGSDGIVVVNSPLVLTGFATDDGVPIPAGLLTYAWEKISGPGNVEFSSATVASPTAVFRAAGTYVLRFSASDSIATGFDDVTVRVIPIENSAPIVSAGEDFSAYRNAPVSLAGSATDDGLPFGSGTITYKWSIVSGPGQVSVVSPTSPTTLATFYAVGTYVLSLTASDGALSSSAFVNVVVGLPENNATPTIRIFEPESGASISPNTYFEIAARAIDVDGHIAKVEFFADGALLGQQTLSMLGDPSVYFWPVDLGLAAGTYTFVARATDNLGFSTDSAPVSVTIANNSNGGNAVVHIASPLPDARISAPVPVRGVIADSSVTGWVLEYRLKASEDRPPEPWSEFASGSGAVGVPALLGSAELPGDLGMFDPTLLLNGIYEIRLRATTSTGTVVDGPFTVLVEGNMKVGAFSVAFNDLTLGTSGIPISVIRSYDSRDKRVGDFGPGWRLAIADVRVQKNGNMGLAWWQSPQSGNGIQFYTVEPVKERILSVVMPDGETHRFRAGALVKNRPGDPDNASFATVVREGIYKFYAVGDTTSTLEPLNAANELNDRFWLEGTGFQDLYTGEYLDFDAGPYNPTRFRLTTKDGSILIVDERLGLLSMHDRSGNQLVVNRDAQNRVTGLTSIQNAPEGPISRAVSIQRNSLTGRVDSITDLENRTLDYLYDAQGRLTSFTDRELHTTQFQYELTDDSASRFFHYLTRIIDPRGLPALRCEFDADGRLVKQIDADGNETSFARGIDPDAGRYEKITDRLGRETSYFYDDRGNVTTKIDPLGATTTFDYYPDSDRVKFEEDHYGNVKAFAYDVRGNVTVEILGASMSEDPSAATTGYITRTTYADFSAPLSMIDPDGRLQSFTYDPDTQELLTHTTGQLAPGADAGVVAATPATTTYSYNSDGTLASVTDALGNVTSTTYTYSFADPAYPGAVKLVTSTVVDPAGIAGSDPANAAPITLRTSHSYFDVQENLLATVTPRTLSDGSTETAPTRYVYDTENRLRFTQQPDGRIQETRYTVFGQTDKTLEWPAGTDISALIAAGPDGPTAGARVTSMVYDSRGNVEATTRPDGTTVKTGYDLENRAIWTEDAKGYRTFTVYDELGRSRLTIYPDTDDGQGSAAPTTSEDPRLANNARREITYDLIGRVHLQIDEEGATTEFTYENNCGCAMRRKQSIQYLPTGNLVTEYEYDKAGNVRFVTDPRGARTETRYDSHGRPVVIVLPATDEHPSTETATAYNPLGQRVALTDAEGKVTRHRYDALGRLIEVRQYLSATSAAADSALSLSTADAGLVSTRYAYDEAGNQIAQTDARDHVTRYDYDSSGRRVKRTLPAVSGPAAFETQRYDQWGDLWQRDDFAGYTTTFGYDTMHRLTSKEADANHPSRAYSHAAVRIDYGYDENGAPFHAVKLGATGAILHEQYTPRNPRGWLDSKALPDGHFLVYGYRANGGLSSVDSSDPNGVHVGYRYDALNRLAFVDDDSADAPTTRTTEYAYNANGSLEAVTAANGIRHAYTYDSLNRLRNLRVGTGAAGETTVTDLLQGYAYLLRATGHRQQVAETMPAATSRTVTYGYDELYRLTGETVTGDPAQAGAVAYTLDKVGNREARDSQLAGLGSQAGLTYNPRDQVSTDTYDANGNTRNSDLLATRYPLLATSAVPDVYDFEDRLIIRTRADGSTVNLSYDADGMRIGKTILSASAQLVSSTSYLVDGNTLTGYAQVVEERTTIASGTTLKIYTYGLDLLSVATEETDTTVTPSVVVSSTLRYYAYDGGGSVRALTDEAGAITDRYTYDAFGVLLAHTGTSDNAYLYRGEQWDTDLGLYYNRARYLNAESGRFWNQDIFEGVISCPVSLHKYLYAHANAVSGLDPSGYVFTEEMAFGRAVHKAIAEDFKASGVDRYAEKYISTVANGNPSTSEFKRRWGTILSKRVDLVSLAGNGLDNPYHVFEIKPYDAWAEGVVQLSSYVFFANMLADGKFEFDFGNSDVYSPPRSLIVNGEIVLFSNPIQGVILYISPDSEKLKAYSAIGTYAAFRAFQQISYFNASAGFQGLGARITMSASLRGL